jgi:predicted aldo/keto reductase-like oxidoreductase
LRTTHLDLWQLHDLRTQSDLQRIFGPGGALEALVQARAEGLVRFLGLTGHHDPTILQEAMRRFPFDTALLVLNTAGTPRAINQRYRDSLSCVLHAEDRL